MPTVQYLKTLPSYFSGSFRQTLATLVPPRAFVPAGNCPLLLVPGAFCTASVMNQLGRALEARGFSVCVAPTFPYYLSAAANTCRLDQAALRLLRFLDTLAAERGIGEVCVAGHSNGGLIPLLAHEMISSGRASCRVQIKRVIAMATPFGGFPLARPLSPFLPFCSDIIADCATLKRAASASSLVVHSLVAGGDSLIPPSRQSLDPLRRTVMEGFQHMDFIVGAPEKIERTATEVARWTTKAC